MNPYERCPVYLTPRFLLRKVELSDAAALLDCYADLEAVSRMNADNCTSDFHMTTLEEMTDCIRFWLDEYRRGMYVRFAVADRAQDRVIGTVEIFGGERGVLRIDLPTDSEDRQTLGELIELAVRDMIRDFPTDRMLFKVENAPERRAAALSRGFRESCQTGYMEWRKMK